MNNRNSAGRNGLHRTSGGVSIVAAAIDQVKDGYHDAKRSSSTDGTDEVICCTSYDQHGLMAEL